MDSDTDELPYIVWYQCRMCTDVFIDDIEKMFGHMDSKHGAMIDCEELRSVVYKNGLAMGGLPRHPPLDPSECDERGGDLESPPVIAPDAEDEDGFHKVLQQKDDEVVCKIGIQLNGVAGKEKHDQSGGDYEDDYEESAYQTTNEDAVCKLEGYVNDDEEQLPEGDFDESMNGEEQYDQYEDNQDENDTQEAEISTQSSNYTEDYDDFDPYHDDDEVSGEQSLNEDDLDEQIFEDDLEEEEENEQDGNEMYPNGLNQAAEAMGYGYTCKYCNKFFSTRRGVESHEQNHQAIRNGPSFPVKTSERRVFPCRMCKSKTFPSFKDLKSHVKTHTTDRIHICKFCFATFHNTASLTKHLIIHKRENPHKCFCGKTFVSANTLKIHKKIHTGVKPFVCDVYDCGRAFSTKSTLESHLRTHTGEKPYQCSYCSSSFTTSSAKYRHERHVHKAPEPAI